MGEALEKWDLELLRSVVPEICDIIERIDARAQAGASGQRALHHQGPSGAYGKSLRLCLHGGQRRGARSTPRFSKTICSRTGIAVYPERFQNKTNGITPRRWLGLCNPELCGLIDSKVGTGFLTESRQAGRSSRTGIDEMTVKQFNAIKLEKKRQLCARH